MSIISVVKKKFLDVLLGVVGKHARVPRHIAFIMDGNRRFAERTALSRKSLGHKYGFRKLEEVSKY